MMGKEVSKVSALIVLLLAYFLMLHVWFALSQWPRDMAAVAFTILYAVAVIGSFREWIWGFALAGLLGGVRIILLAYTGLKIYASIKSVIVVYAIIEQSLIPLILVALAAVKIRLLGKNKGNLNNSTTKELAK